MAAETLDLTGKTTGDDDEQKGQRQRQGQGQSSKRRERGDRSGEEKPGARARRRNEGELRDRLLRVFDRLAEWLEGRGDAELAKVIREDAGAMTGGLVSLTKPIAAVRAPLLVVVAIAEPLLAFGRVARILGARFADRRAARAAEHELQAAELAAAAEAEAAAEAGRGYQGFGPS